MNKYNGIAGLTGREAIGAVVTIGTKLPGKPNPVHRQMLFIKSVLVDGNGIRPDHPAFTAFNSAPEAERKLMRGILVHSDMRDCFQYYLQAYKLPGFMPTPNKQPACVGDGIRATRFLGDVEGFCEIKCPNELCEFRIGSAPSCKPFGRLLFRPRWRAGSAAPTPLFKLATQSWNSIRAIMGIFEEVERHAQQWGLPSVNFYGLPFVLELTEKTNAQKKTRFPVLTASIDGDVVEFLIRQRDQLKQLGGTIPTVAALTDDSEQEPEVMLSDYQQITPGLYKPTT